MAHFTGLLAKGVGGEVESAIALFRHVSAASIEALSAKDTSPVGQGWQHEESLQANRSPSQSTTT